MSASKNYVKNEKNLCRLEGQISIPKSTGAFSSSRTKIIILLASALLSMSYLVLSYSSNFKSSLVRTRKLSIKDGHFSFLVGSLISTSEVRQSTIYFLFNRKIKKLEILLTDRTYPALIKTSYRIVPLSSMRFSISAKENMQDWLVRCIPQKQIETLEVKVVIKPIFKVDFLLFQFVILFFIILLIVLAILFIFRLITHQSYYLENIIRQSLVIFLLICFAIYLYFFFKIKAYVEFLNILGIPLLKVLFFNLLLAVLLCIFFLIYKKKRIKLIYLPFIISLLYFTVFLKYELKFCGDAIQWVPNVAYRLKILFFAEFLSFTWAKAVYHLFNPIFSDLTSARVLAIHAKIIGVLFSFVLYAFLRSQRDISSDNKLVFFISISALTMSALFFGHPEFSFYQVPFLLISVLFSIKYVSCQSGKKNLYLAAFFLILAGLFHGSGYFSFPVLFLLPLIKTNHQRLDKKRILFLLRDYGIILLIAAGLILSILLLSASLGYRVSFQNVRGGGDFDQFTDLFPSRDATSWGETFLEIRYLWERGLGVFLAFPILFFLLFNKIKKWKGIPSSDFILFLFGITQISVFFLWSYDLGFRDFDLIISPWIVMNLLFMKIFLNIFNPEAKTLKGALFIFLFAVTSQFFLLLFWTANFLPIKF